MYRSVIVRSTWAASFAFSACMWGQSSVRLETEQTILQFEAGIRSPAHQLADPRQPGVDEPGC